MIEFDDGNGPALYVAGDFESIGDVEAFRIAKMDAEGTFSAVGSGIPSTHPHRDWIGIWTMTVFDDGTGPALYVGGNFTSTPEVPAEFVAKWDGTQWSSVGGGLPGPVTSFAVFDDGSGPALYAGGAHWAGSDPWPNHTVLGYLAKWEGTHWSLLSQSFDRQYSAGSWVDVLHVYDDGTGPALYVGGLFDLIDGTVVSSPARWDGRNWSSAGGGAWSGTLVDGQVVLEGGLVSQMFEHDGKLYIAGQFRYVDPNALHQAWSVAAWDGNQWHLFGNGLRGLGNELATVTALHVVEINETEHIYAGGNIRGSAETNLHPPVRWDGSDWHIMDGGIWGVSYSGVPHIMGFHPAPKDRYGRPGLYVFGKFMRTGAMLDGTDNTDIAIWRECGDL